ncbi:MAG: Rrf2 family transcriptional regulator [Candidatus Omnitrophica bacterium]|nr:Rrf2 family transcriptional regulator [Candidatus Omnitrophota bacterium]
MKLITRDTDYALRALMFIAKQKERMVSVSDLVEKLKIPRPFLRKLLQILNIKGLLDSHKVKGGGFMLAAVSRKISLLNLMEIFQGKMKLSDYTFKGKRCPHIKTCRLKKKLDDIERSVIADLKSINIASLIRG